MQASPGAVEGRLNIGFFAKSASLFRLLRPLAFAQTYSRAAAILVDELDARLFKGASDFLLLYWGDPRSVHRVTLIERWLAPISMNIALNLLATTPARHAQP